MATIGGMDTTATLPQEAAHGMSGDPVLTGNILGLDPGNLQSGWVIYDPRELNVPWSGTTPNEDLKTQLEVFSETCSLMVMETMRPRGMPTSLQEMETLIWSGRFIEAWNRPYRMVYRDKAKLHLCGKMAAKDTNVRQALIDRFGGNDIAIGGERCAKCKGKGWFGAGRPVCQECDGKQWAHPPGCLHKVSSHSWPALAVALTWIDQHE